MSLILMTCPSLVFGQTNLIPFADSFEQYSDGQSIVDTNGVGADGWGGAGGQTAAVAVAVATNYTYGLGYPITGATHTVVMQFQQTVSNTFDTTQYTNESGIVSNVTVDIMLQAGQISAPPTMDNGVQAAVYVNTNGQLVVWHSYYSLNFATNFQAWTALTPPLTIASGEWVRVTLNMSYRGNFSDSDEHWFTVRLNGGALITNDLGYLDSTNSSLVRGGPFFMCGDSGINRSPAGVNHSYFSGLSLLGVGMVDDAKVSVGVRDTYSPSTGRETLTTWMGHYGLSDPNGDPDLDGATTGEEYIADTIPTDGTSVLRIFALATGSSTNVVAWTGTKSSTNVLYYKVYRSDALTQPSGGWTQWSGTWPVDLSGTNVYPDGVNAGTNQAFYKIMSVGTVSP